MSKKDPSLNEAVDELKQFVKDTILDSQEDFKQYVDRSVANHSSELERKVTEELRQIKKEMREGFEGVGDAVAGHQDKIDDHEGRIGSLEAA